MRTSLVRAVFLGVFAIFLAAAVFSSSCKGPVGPPGPTGATGAQGLQGVQGLQGPQGEGRKVVLATTVGIDGGAVVSLPSGAGTNANKPPSVSSYIGTGDGVWITVADGDYDTRSPYTGVVCVTQTSEWHAVMVNAPSGWVAVFVVLY